MILVSHPTGNNFVKALLDELEKEKNLHSYETCLAPHKSDFYINILPAKIKKQLLRRVYNIPKQKIKQHPMREITRISASKLNLSFLTKHEKGWASTDSVFNDLDNHVAKVLPKLKGKIKGVYCYEDGALETFKAAKKMGIKCFYDLPIGYWKEGRKIQEEEARLNPEWKDTLTGNKDSKEKLARKDEELKLADVVFVPSNFVKNTLKNANFNGKIVVSPFGSPTVYDGLIKKTETGKLKVLFVGSLGQRKGVSYLLDAVKQIEDKVELTLIGKPTGKCKELDKAIKKYNWIESLTNQDILREMQKNDVLVFPSLFEGFALVILEAMSQGTSVITTPNSGAEGIITNGKDGFIVPIRSSESIKQKLELLHKNRKLLAKMSENARQKAKQYTWKKYSGKITNEIKKVL